MFRSVERKKRLALSILSKIVSHPLLLSLLSNLETRSQGLTSESSQPGSLSFRVIS